jgi:putative Mg2+ transporter-C (MgtC) family protein
MLIDFQADIEVISRIVIAFLLGGLIGLERELHGISAGIRTYGAICLGACVFGIVSLSVAGAIGFLGGGIIFRQEDKYISGLTTAATLWATAAVGLAVALGMYMISLLTALLIFLLLFLPRLKWWKKISKKSGL